MNEATSTVTPGPEDPVMAPVLALAALLDDLDDESFVVGAAKALAVLTRVEPAAAWALLDVIGPRLDDVLADLDGDVSRETGVTNGADVSRETEVASDA